MTRTATTAPWAPNTRAALAISAAVIGDLLLAVALALTCARAVRHRHAAPNRRRDGEPPIGERLPRAAFYWSVPVAPRTSILPSFARTS